MKKTTLAVGTLLAALSAATIVPAAYADDTSTQQTTDTCGGSLCGGSTAAPATCGGDKTCSGDTGN